MGYRCPLCGNIIGDDLKVFKDHVDAEIVGLIKEDHSKWVEKNGSCPKCYEYYKKQLKGE